MLDTDPALRWQVQRDVAREPVAVWQATRARVPTEGMAARLLALQDAALVLAWLLLPRAPLISIAEWMAAVVWVRVPVWKKRLLAIVQSLVPVPR